MTEESNHAQRIKSRRCLHLYSARFHSSSVCRKRAHETDVAAASQMAARPGPLKIEAADAAVTISISPIKYRPLTNFDSIVRKLISSSGTPPPSPPQRSIPGHRSPEAPAGSET